MRTQITRGEYYQVVGLLTLAASMDRRMRDIEGALGDLFGAERDTSGGYLGHITDAVYGGSGEPDADRLLHRLGITVERGA